MSKAYVFNDHLSSADRSKLEEVISAAGLDAVFGYPADVSSLDPDKDIGVVALPVTPEDVATVNARTTEFAGAGVRVVAIWLEDQNVDGTGIPDSIDKYGAIVSISSEDLEDTLTGEADVWEEPDGEPRRPTETKRNKC